jgi:glycosyltransferase involved in cell wall biosynthesis
MPLAGSRFFFGGDQQAGGPEKKMLDDIRLRTADIKHPLVTIIVTNFNYEKYIIACLKSVAGQSYPHYRCVIVDDGSKDGSVTLIEEFIHSGESRDKFSLIRHEHNRGQLAAFKTGLMHAEGVFVVFVDADDLLFKDFLVSHIQAHLDSLPVAFTCSNHYQINENNEIVSGSYSGLTAKIGCLYIRPRPLHHSFWIWTSTSSMMFRKTILDLIMPDAGEHFRVCADNYLCHFANLIGGSKLMGAVHGCYRRHGANFFGGNPVVGGHLPTGNLKKHPKHHILRQSILSHLLQNHESFSSLLSERTFLKTLLNLAGPSDLFRIKRTFPDYFVGKSRFFSFKFAIYSFLLRTGLLFRKLFCFRSKTFKYG